jgi:hypothetical protein
MGDNRIGRGRPGLVWWIVVALVLLSPLASSAPDGLERVAEDLGFGERAVNLLAVPLPDYLWPGVAHSGVATILAGLAGAALALGAGLGLAKLLARRS